MVRFCPECGTATLKRVDGGRERDACPSCGWVHYAETAIGVGALVLRGERVLLVERGIPPVGRWTLPSGWIEQEDTLATAVVRELKEETSLDCSPVGIICVRNIPKPTRNEMYVCFLCEVDPAAEPVPDGEESTQARFVHSTEFDGIDLSPFSRYIIEEYRRWQPIPWPMHGASPYFTSYPPMTVFSPF
jgi:ADP-ribose pyrophosphatase YjhB (NUDIX family)